jgi:flagellum-specific peptidoglycan hydrolase FlgJ
MYKILILLFLPIISFTQSKKEVYNYLVKIDCKYPDIVTSQAILETGHFKSYSCKKRNNLFGLWNHAKQKFYNFDSWQDSCHAYLKMIQYKYKDGDYYVFLKNIGYASDSEYINKLKRIKL